jgi:predicted  nucleic acid-binding Zn-ribbon protein
MEDEILVLMESVDGAVQELKKREAVVKDEQEKGERFKKSLNDDIALVEKELEALKQRRAREVKHIDKEVYELYFSILTTKKGLAVVEARDEVCQGCNMNIPPQLFVELKKHERIMQCPQCGRILSWRGDVSPQTAHDSPASRNG